MSEQTRSSGTGDGTGDDLRGRLDRLIEEAPGLGAGREQRREHLIERAEERGLGRPEAEQAYDMAREVGLDPAVAMAIVVEGLSVQALDSPSADVDAADPVEPEWVDAPPSREQASRELRLRQTFRRVRTLLEREPDTRAAFRALAREPDLERYDY